MEYDDKEITILNLENAGMFDMLSRIYQTTSDAFGNIIYNNHHLRHQFIRLFREFENEYIQSSRSDIFFGTKTGSEVRGEAFEYGTSQTMKLFMTFKMLESDVFRRFIEHSGKAPEEFLKAMKDILNNGNRGKGSGQW